MTQTFEHIAAVLPQCLASLVEGYIWPADGTAAAIARSGHLELCERRGIYTHVFDVATDDGDMALAAWAIARGNIPFKSSYTYRSLGWWCDLDEYIKSRRRDRQRRIYGSAPLKFWFSRDPGLALPWVAYGERIS